MFLDGRASRDRLVNSKASPHRAYNDDGRKRPDRNILDVCKTLQGPDIFVFCVYRFLHQRLCAICLGETSAIAVQEYLNGVTCPHIALLTVKNNSAAPARLAHVVQVCGAAVLQYGGGNRKPERHQTSPERILANRSKAVGALFSGNAVHSPGVTAA